MIYNPNKELIPFHPNKHWYYLDDQCKDNEKFILTLLSYSTYSFSSIIPNNWTEISVKLFKINGDEVAGDLFVHEAYYNHETNLTYLSVDVETNASSGVHYITISDPKFEDGVLFSEPFCIKDGYQPKFTLRWSNKCLLVGNVIYPKNLDDQFRFCKLHLDDITVVLSDTIVEEEVVEDEFGDEKPISQMVIQKYLFSTGLPFYIIEALSTLPLHSEIYLDEFNKPSKKFSKVEVASEPEEFGCLSKFTMKFETNRISKAGCCGDQVTKKVNYSEDDYSEDDYSTS